MRGINAESYRLLVLGREFDDRLGWAKWSFPNCSEWLAWRCGLSASAAREKLRTAHALARLPAISKALDAGRLSYTKVRDLTVLVEDEKGHPLAVSRKTRALSAALRRAVEARDRHCTFPGCRRTEGTVPHHIKPWGEGGEHAAR